MIFRQILGYLYFFNDFFNFFGLFFFSALLQSSLLHQKLILTISIYLSSHPKDVCLCSSNRGCQVVSSLTFELCQLRLHLLESSGDFLC